MDDGQHAATDERADERARGASDAAEVAEPADGGQDHSEDHIDDVAELIRVATMLQTLGEEVRHVDLDEAARERLAGIQRRAVDVIERNLSPGLRDELGGFTWPFAEDETPSEPELRIVQAQLSGWLGGLFQGLQAAAMSRQLAQQRGAGQQQPALPGQQQRPAREGGAYL